MPAAGWSLPTEDAVTAAYRFMVNTIGSGMVSNRPCLAWRRLLPVIPVTSG